LETLAAIKRKDINTRPRIDGYRIVMSFPLSNMPLIIVTKYVAGMTLLKIRNIEYILSRGNINPERISVGSNVNIRALNIPSC